MSEARRRAYFIQWRRYLMRYEPVGAKITPAGWRAYWAKHHKRIRRLQKAINALHDMP